MDKDELAIVLASDENYLPFVWPLVRDLDQILPTCPPVILMFDGDLDLTKGLQEYCQQAGIDLRIFDLSNDLSREYLNTIRYITRATFARLFAPSQLHQNFERLLYLDIDILVVRDFSFLFEIPLNQVVAAVPESFDSMFKAYSTYDFAYFNAGVLLIDTEKWVSGDYLDICLQLLQEQGPFNCQDQDVLNLVFKNQWQVLPPTTNCFVSTHDHTLDLPQLNFPAIVHFVGAHKPWKGFAWTRWHKTWIERNLDLMAATEYSNGKNTLPVKYFLLPLIKFSMRFKWIKILSRTFNLKQSKVLRKLLS